MDGHDGLEPGGRVVKMDDLLVFLTQLREY
jgi:hypothetical protein